MKRNDFDFGNDQIANDKKKYFDKDEHSTISNNNLKCNNQLK